MRRPDSDINDADLDPANQEPDYDPEPEVTKPTDNLAAALSRAQGQLRGAIKDSTNPHFKSRYADLASVWEACRKPLADNGLSIIQFTQPTIGEGVLLFTRLLHTSGEFIEGATPLLMGKQDMQALGSAITYARRYGLAAMVGISPEDDDGNAAVARSTEPAVIPDKPEGFDKWINSVKAAAAIGTEAMAKAYGASTAEHRKYLGATAPELKDSLKLAAQQADVANQEIPF